MFDVAEVKILIKRGPAGIALDASLSVLNCTKCWGAFLTSFSTNTKKDFDGPTVAL